MSSTKREREPRSRSRSWPDEREAYPSSLANTDRPAALPRSTSSPSLPIAALTCDEASECFLGKCQFHMAPSLSLASPIVRPRCARPSAEQRGERVGREVCETAGSTVGCCGNRVIL